MLKTILFDLDGTLLPMEEKAFLSTYYRALYAEIGSGIPKDAFFAALQAGVDAMLRGDDGDTTNDRRFWSIFCSMLGVEEAVLRPQADRFYTTGFRVAKQVVEPSPLPLQIVRTLQEKGYELVLTTNPVFPLCATHERMGWIGLAPSDFAHITSYENSHYAKPDLRYYREVLETIGCAPEECMMIGNSVPDDLPAAAVGVRTYLVTNYQIGTLPEEAAVQTGSLSDLLLWAKALPNAINSAKN